MSATVAEQGTVATSLRIYGGLAFALTSAVQAGLVLALSNRFADHREWEWTEILMVLLLPVFSGLVSGATVGAGIGDRCSVTSIRSALLLGAVVALLAAVIYCGLTVLHFVALAALGRGAAMEFMVLQTLFLLAWTVCVGMPLGALAGFLLYEIGGTLMPTKR